MEGGQEGGAEGTPAAVSVHPHQMWKSRPRDREELPEDTQQEGADPGPERSRERDEGAGKAEGIACSVTTPDTAEGPLGVRRHAQGLRALVLCTALEVSNVPS